MLARVIGLLCGDSLPMEAFYSGGRRRAQKSRKANTTHQPQETQIQYSNGLSPRFYKQKLPLQKRRLSSGTSPKLCREFQDSLCESPPSGVGFDVTVTFES